MISRALDSNNDIIFESGKFLTVSDGAETVQHVRSRLLFYKGEWKLNINAGVPWFQQVFVKPMDLNLVELIIKTEILQTNGVEKLLTFSTEFEDSNRRMTIRYSAETIYGEINVNEVKINA